MDFTGRRQSDNIEDRRKNWRIYEHFRTPEKTGRTVASNRHTDAVERAIEAIRAPRKKDFSQDEFDFLLETGNLAVPKGGTVMYDSSVIGNLLRGDNEAKSDGDVLRRRRPQGK
jgi:hypothetical protein